MQAPKKFDRMYCSDCENDLLPIVLQKFKSHLGGSATIIDLVSKWDSLPNEKNDGLMKYVHAVGCFLPNPPHVSVCPGPNYVLLDRPQARIQRGDLGIYPPSIFWK